MKDRVGSNLPSQKETDSLLSLVRDVTTKIEKFGVRLTREERQQTLKFRTGGEAIAKLVADVAERHSLELPGISTDAMRADLALVESLRPLADAVDSLSQLVSDTVLEAQSECWWATTAYYTALTRMMKTNAAMEREISPAVDFFARGRRGKQAAG